MAKALSESQSIRLNQYATAVIDELGTEFEESKARFTDSSRLLRRFSDAVEKVREGGATFISAVAEAHNELCVASLLLSSHKPYFTSLEYEPVLPGCAKSIDFRAVSADPRLTAFVDVKTISPKALDRWDQHEKALREGWYPENVFVSIDKDWMGGEISHGEWASRRRMLEYTLELEQKLEELTSRDHDHSCFVLALCGSGFYWDWWDLGYFVHFYQNGVHREDDAFSQMELHWMNQHGVVLRRSITRFACLFRRQLDVRPSETDWDVSLPREPWL